MSPSIPLPPHLSVEASLVADKSYRVRDLRTGARYVLRFCAAPKAVVKRRIDALGEIVSPSLVAERDLIEVGGSLLTLRPWIEGRPLEPAACDLVTLIDSVAVALEPLHAKGIAHGRLHAGNLIRDTQGRLFLVDAADPVPGVDAAGALHAAPEQLRGEAPTVRTDVYAAALLAFEACTGRRAFAGAPFIELARRTLYEGIDFTFEESSRMDPEILALLRRALAREPRARCASLRELMGGLRRPAAAPTPVRIPTQPRAQLRLEITRHAVHAAKLLGNIAIAARSRVPTRVGVTLAVAAVAVIALPFILGGGLEQEVATLIEQKEYKQASVLLASADREGADPALVEKLEGDLDCAQGNPLACLEHYARALEQDPDLASNDTIRTNTLAAFSHADKRWLVAKVAAKLDDVDDELLEHATDTRYWIRWNAVRALEERGRKDQIPYGVVYGLDVLHASTCATRERSLRKAVQAGAVDARPYLLQAKAKSDGKLFGDWCLGGELDAAIRRLDAQGRRQKM